MIKDKKLIRSKKDSANPQIDEQVAGSIHPIVVRDQA
jgi:hypothetical protein